MSSKEIKKADWHEQQEVYELEQSLYDEQFSEGYDRYLTGDPVEKGEKPSPAYVDGYLGAKADRDTEEAIQQAEIIQPPIS